MAKSKDLEKRIRELENELDDQRKNFESIIHDAKVTFIRIGTFSPMTLPPSGPKNGLNLTKVVHKQKVMAAKGLYRLETDPKKAEELVKKYQLPNVPHEDWNKYEAYGRSMDDDLGAAEQEREDWAERMGVERLEASR